MLFADLGAGVFMTTVASVVAIVIVHVTGLALRIVMTVESEKIIVPF